MTNYKFKKVMITKQLQYKGTFLTMHNYKEPLRKIPRKEGIGFYGALLMTLDGTKVQCHMCGELFSDMGNHARLAHKITVRDYKTKFGLAYLTALLSDTEREARKLRTLAWLKRMSPEEKTAFIERRKQDGRRGTSKRTHGQPTLQLETYNKRGTCPDQLLDKILEIKKKLGRIPTSKEFTYECGTQRYKHLIFKVFGSWNKALQLLGEKPKVPDKRGFTHDYDDEELLSYLRNFTIKTNKIPTTTDFRAKVLPTFDTYIRHFGSIEFARKLAGVYDYIK